MAPVAAAKHPGGPQLSAPIIRGLSGRIFTVPILDPFTYVPVHIMKTPVVRGKTAYRHGGPPVFPPWAAG